MSIITASYDDLLGSEQSKSHVIGYQLLLLQFYALLVKRVQYSIKRYLMFAVQNLFPLTVVIMCLGISKYLTSVTDPPPLEFNPDSFFTINEENYAMISGHSKGYTEPFYNSIFQHCGFGPQTNAEKCSEYNYSKYSSPDDSYSSLNLSKNYPFSCNHSEPDADVPCDCRFWTGNETVCQGRPARPLPLRPPCLKSVDRRSTKLQDLRYGSTNAPYNADYSNIYVTWSRLQYAEQRYGGVHFGDERLYIPTELDKFYDDPSSDPLNKLPVLAVKKMAKVDTNC